MFDKYLSKFISRKLIVWIVATLLVFFGKIDGKEWAVISIVYLFAQGYVDIKTIIKNL